MILIPICLLTFCIGVWLGRRAYRRSMIPRPYNGRPAKRRVMEWQLLKR